MRGKSGRPTHLTERKTELQPESVSCEKSWASTGGSVEDERDDEADSEGGPYDEVWGHERIYGGATMVADVCSEWRSCVMPA